MLKACL